MYIQVPNSLSRPHILLLIHPPAVFFRLPGLESPSFLWIATWLILLSQPWSLLVESTEHSLAKELCEEVLPDHVLLQ